MSACICVPSYIQLVIFIVCDALNITFKQSYTIYKMPLILSIQIVFFRLFLWGLLLQYVAQILETQTRGISNVFSCKSLVLELLEKCILQYICCKTKNTLKQNQNQAVPLSLHAMNIYFSSFFPCVGITWSAGNPTKCLQQESRITAAVQIMNDRETLFSFIKVPQMNNSWFQISGF